MIFSTLWLLKKCNFRILAPPRVRLSKFPGKSWGNANGQNQSVFLEVAMRKDVALACSLAVPIMAHYGFGVGAIFRLWMTLGGLEAIYTAIFSMCARGDSYEITGDGGEMADLGPGSESVPWLNDAVAEVYQACVREFGSAEGKRLLNKMISDKLSAATGWKKVLRCCLNPQFRELDLGEVSPIEVWAIRMLPVAIIDAVTLDIGVSLQAKGANIELALNRFFVVTIRKVSIKVPLRVSPSLVSSEEDEQNIGAEEAPEDEDEIEVVEEAKEEAGDVVPPLQLEHVEVSLLRHPIVEYDSTVRICGCPLGFLNYLRPFILKFLLNPVSDLIHFPRKVIVAKNQQ